MLISLFSQKFFPKDEDAMRMKGDMENKASEEESSADTDEKTSEKSEEEEEETMDPEEEAMMFYNRNSCIHGARRTSLDGL